MTPDEIPAELRAGPLSAEAKAELRRWVPRYEHRAMTSGYDTLALLDEIDALLARLTTAEADADRLAQCLFLNDASDDTSEHALRLHDDAVALRERP